MKIHKKAHVEWEGTIKEGTGHISTQSGALDEQPYGFNTRFEGKEGTNPEELIAAAHASCFTMALSKQLEENGVTPKDLTTDCTVTLEKDGDGFAVTGSALSFTATLNGADQNAFEKSLNEAKENCPISKLLSCNITLETKFTDSKSAAAA